MAMEIWRPGRGMLRRGPLGEASRYERDVHNLFDRMFRDFFGTPWGGADIRGAAPPVDLIDHKDEVVLRADVPGLEQKDVQVEVQDGTLMVSGQRKEEAEARDEDYYYCERWGGSFQRTIQLPAGVDTDKINATFKNGVLEVHLPKTKEAKGKKVEIRTA